MVGGGGGQEKGAREGEGLEGTLSRPLPSLPSLALLDYVSSLKPRPNEDES